MLASIPSTMTYFFTYEVAKRKLTQYMPDPVAHFLSGAFGDLVACSISMPAEVIKVSLQMQGRHDNPLQLTPYNYRNARDAFRTIYQTEGVAALFQGYRATITRDMPFSAIQFAIYGKTLYSFARAFLNVLLPTPFQQSMSKRCSYEDVTANRRSISHRRWRLANHSWPVQWREVWPAR